MKDLTQYKLNITPSPFDPRNWRYESFVKAYTYPTTLDLRPFMFAVRDQGYQGSCAAMAGAAMKDYQEIKDVSMNEYMSPQFIYNNREDLNQEGMYMLDLMKILKNKGTCVEHLHPYGNLNIPNAEAYANALNYVVKGYAEVSTVEDLKQALYENGPCVIAVPVYNYTTRMWYKRAGDSLLGGHAMSIVGYTEEGFIIRNSWGDDWGDEGYTIFPYSDWGCQWEVWSTVDAESDPNPPDPGPGPDPEPSWFSKNWRWVIGIGAAIVAAIIYFIAR